jgi:hypothetical protein
LSTTVPAAGRTDTGTEESRTPKGLTTTSGRIGTKPKRGDRVFAGDGDSQTEQDESQRLEIAIDDDPISEVKESESNCFELPEKSKD